MPKYYAQKILELHTPDRMLFGTDTPWHTPNMESKLLNTLNISNNDMEKITQKRNLPAGFTYEIIEGNEEVKKLYELPEFAGFDNSIQYGENYVGPDEIILYAKHNNTVVAMAGASKDTEEMWQIGVDVKKDYRNKGLATALVSNLANIIIEKGKIPYYSTTSSNIPSQLVAYKCGFMPFWYSKKTINRKYIK